MNNTQKCAACGDTGKLPGSDYLDCGHCGTATERAAMDAAALEYIQAYEGDLQHAPEDVRWFVHQRARQIEREAQAARIADLERQLEEAEDLIAQTSHGAAERISEMQARLDAALSGKLAKAAAPSAPAVERQPVAIRWPNSRGKFFYAGVDDTVPLHAISTGENLYTAPQAADTDKVREAIKALHPGVDGILFGAEKKGFELGFWRVRDAALTILDAMAAQAPVREVPGWQPIETAPKDGTDILICQAWDASGNPMCESSHALFTQRAAWWANENGGNGSWIVYNSMVLDPECFFEPTHWMSVPPISVTAAPVQQEGA